MNINQLMKQAQQIQKKITKTQNELNEKIFDFESNDHMISGQMKGNMEIVHLQIDASLLSDKEMLEDMLIVVLNESRKNISNLKEKEIGKLTGNVNIPNLF